MSHDFELGQDLAVQVPPCLDGDHGTGGQLFDERPEQLAQLAAVNLELAVRGIEENGHRSLLDRLKGPGPAVSIGEPNLGAILVSEDGDVAVDQPHVLTVLLDEDRPRSAPAERLQPHRSGAREQIDGDPPGHQVADNVENRLANQVAGRPHICLGPRPVDLVSPALPRDDPHGATPPFDSIRVRSGSPRASRRQGLLTYLES